MSNATITTTQAFSKIFNFSSSDKTPRLEIEKFLVVTSRG